MANTSCTMARGHSNATIVDCCVEADFQYHLFTIIYSTVFVLGLLENVLALYLLTCKVKHTSHSYIYLINLAVADTLFVCILPFKIHYHLNQNDWIFGDMACRITGALYYINIYVSIAFFTCICMDRYVAVLHPFTYIRIKVTHYRIVVTVFWLVAASIMIPLILGGPLHNKGTENKTACFENFSLTSWTHRMMPYNVCALLFGFVIPFAIILISYPLIAKRIAHTRRSIHKKKALRTIYLILLISILCFLPYHLTHLLHFLMRVQLIQSCLFTNLIYKMRRVTLALVSFNCCLNPILYYFTSSSKPWHLGLKFRSKTKVYTICDRKFNDYPYKSKPTTRPPTQQLNELPFLKQGQ
ncbi:tRNA pseudouridine synthase-like 1 isoform X1 [Trachemys scripta elegans]|uniref:tRNA pseudouridine synthase-like 1 isoform X1 n=1 Tax=Trachemys scripta elegans TaxID=31138 RepID=UPI0015519397|nr:tRNA pseudouridine synthase-like 1 isoform X1 [Trachemys scripta elegans]XP_034609342.1 tRNA pseudouridine synthase-like 1 isoform X1 [Trachemys scripta elegans]XP_034609343.1 tRNA pseudouridine synthase-like 1 isoform X1 [Trachemys scripta elegans]XP_034609344.1 tRNA pseudouridine synthase-like 1 isoform X1 [Trachemys scripta elegans]XP_034609345.1 tRNA pseudouridine synthase-like 1 isoform X1 [Trachemys scripta elegans]XP_034609346.1 tRNA pseudouridine synthase-like 1 isoform X1 [Trachemy